MDFHKTLQSVFVQELLVNGNLKLYFGLSFSVIDWFVSQLSFRIQCSAFTHCKIT